MQLTMSNLLEKNSDKEEQALKTIGEVSTLLDLPTYVIRFWESKLCQPKPMMLKGRRYYNNDDISLLLQIKHLLYTDGYTIEGVKKYLNENETTKYDNKFTNDEETKNKDLRQLLSNLYKIRNKLFSVLN